MKILKKFTVWSLLLPGSVILLTVSSFTFIRLFPQEDLKNKYTYKDFESAKKCRSCHPGIFEQWVSGNDVAGLYPSLG